MHIDVLTLFPDIFSPYLAASIMGRAQAAGLVSWRLHQIRDYSKDPHSKVDDRPFGGGPGMVMTCQPILDGLAAVVGQNTTPATRIAFTAAGELLTQALVSELARQRRLILLAGHYEGIDQRAIELGQFREITIGDYVLTGGELPALVLIDAVVRQLPGALGHEHGASDESFSPGNAGLLEAPQYTRPREYAGLSVPPELLSGHHGEIARWRRAQAEDRTRTRRPDVWQRLRGEQTED